jgi:hypothetical protein
VSDGLTALGILLCTVAGWVLMDLRYAWEKRPRPASPVGTSRWVVGQAAVAVDGPLEPPPPLTAPTSGQRGVLSIDKPLTDRTARKMEGLYRDINAGILTTATTRAEVVTWGGDLVRTLQDQFHGIDVIDGTPVLRHGDYAIDINGRPVDVPR